MYVRTSIGCMRLLPRNTVNVLCTFYSVVDQQWIIKKYTYVYISLFKFRGHAWGRVSDFSGRIASSHRHGNSFSIRPELSRQKEVNNTVMGERERARKTFRLSQLGLQY